MMTRLRKRIYVDILDKWILLILPLVMIEIWLNPFFVSVRHFDFFVLVPNPTQLQRLKMAKGLQRDNKFWSVKNNVKTEPTLSDNFQWPTKPKLGCRNFYNCLNRESLKKSVKETRKGYDKKRLKIHDILDLRFKWWG